MAGSTDFPHLLRAVLWAALLFGAGCELPGIPIYPAQDGSLEPNPNNSGTCPEQARCGAGNFLEQCGDDGRTFEVVACGLAEVCREGECQDVTGTCDSTRSRPFRLSAREVVFDVPELLADCDCTGPIGCECSELSYDEQRRSVTIENCSSRTIFIQSTTLKETPLRPDGTPVFRLLRSYRDFPIEPGTEQEITIAYRPAPGVSQLAESNLDISLIGESSESFRIPLRTRSYCVTATPVVDVWTLIPGQSLTRNVVLQNCGTEPIELTGAEVADWTGPAEPSVAFSDKLPYRLVGGAEATARLELSPDEPGIFDGVVRFEFDGSQLASSAETVIRGAAADNGCSDAPLGELTVIANSTVEPDLPFTVDPVALISLVPRATEDDLRPFFTLVSSPDFYLGRPNMNATSASLFADVVGTYELEYRGFSPAEGLVTCASQRIPFEVVPSAPLYVELLWRADTDSILDDAGFGRGADLDLYVRAVSEEGEWTDPKQTCFPSAQLPCSEGRGARVSVSRSGWSPESYEFGDVAGRTFSFGVYVRNSYNFGGDDGGIRAQIRVWRDGILDPAASRQSPADPAAEPRIRKANTFWWASSLEDGAAIPIDSYQPGIP